MTVKELKEKLNQFPDHCIIMIPNPNWNLSETPFSEIPATSVTQGINEFDGAVFIDSYTEED